MPHPPEPSPDNDDEPPPHPPEIFKDLVQYCTINNFDLIVGSDVNSHSKFWNSTNDNQRGEALLEYILENDLHVLNEGCKPTFENAVRKEVLDISMSNSNALNLINDWKVEDRHTQSDHKMITFTIDTNKKLDLGLRRNIKKTDWNGYVEELQGKIQVIDVNEVDLDTAATFINEAIISSFENNCKLKPIVLRRDPPWWNKDLQSMKLNVRRLRKKYYRNRTQERHDAFQKADTEYEREREKAKRRE